MRCHLCLEHARVATSVVLLSTDSPRPYVMRLCSDHTAEFEDRADAIIVEVPPVASELTAA